MSPPSLQEAKDLFRRIQRAAASLRRVETVVCPPFLFISELARLSRTVRCRIGAQDVFWESDGAHTGETSPRQLERLGASHVILGHSERRALGETSMAVSRKVRAAIQEGLTPIVCIGERERDEEGEYLHFVEAEIAESLAGLTQKDMPHISIAYEPLWAVGANAERADTPEELFPMTIFIRKTLAKMFGRKSKEVVMRTPILYGGSVEEDNAEGFLGEGGAAGLLVGRTSLDAKRFSAILKIADGLKPKI